MVLKLVACGVNYINIESSLREVGSTLPDYSSREGVWGGSPDLVSRGGAGVGAHVDRYFFSGIRLLGPSFLSPRGSAHASCYRLLHFLGFEEICQKPQNI